MPYPLPTGVILAGGRSTRMQGRDKGLISFMGKPLYRSIIVRLQHQVSEILISANRHQFQYNASGYRIISDSFPGYPGPLGGMLTGLQQANTEWVLFVPCDTPNLPEDLGERLWNNKGDKPIAYADDGERAHPTMALVHRSVQQALHEYLHNGDRKLLLFFTQQQAKSVSFASNKDAFYNINTQEQIEKWEKILARR